MKIRVIGTIKDINENIITLDTLLNDIKVNLGMN